MKFKATTTLFILTIIATGLLAGFFYAWSFTIMHSLDLIAEDDATKSMVSINANIRNGWFAAIFFGAPALVLLSLITSMAVTSKRVSFWVFLALNLAIFTLVITFTIHLPLNEQLANGVEWGSYSAPWVQWNHARTATSMLAFVSMLCALHSLRN